MSVVHDQRPVLRSERAYRRALLRRLMIVCPTTGHSTATGFELSGVPEAQAQQQILVDCLECGQDHEWTIDDAFPDA
jgi:hypothetical protein